MIGEGKRIGRIIVDQIGLRNIWNPQAIPVGGIEGIVKHPSGVRNEQLFQRKILDFYRRDERFFPLGSGNKSFSKSR